MFKLPPDNM